MKYLDYINRFWQSNNEHPLGPNPTVLYFYLLKTANGLAWKDTFRHSDRHIASALGISVNTVRNAKNVLKQRGLIMYKAGNTKGGKSYSSLTIYSVNVSKFDTLSDTLSDTNIRIDIDKNNNPPIIPPMGDEYSFDRFWDLYDKKAGDQKKLRSKWDRLPKKDKAAIFDYLPKYKQAQPDKQYRKNPATFLNNHSWLDEIVGATTPPQINPTDSLL